MAAYDLEIKEFFADAGFTGTNCAGPVIPSMGYAVAGQAPTVPGPLIFSHMCAPCTHPAVLRSAVSCHASACCRSSPDSDAFARR